MTTNTKTQKIDFHKKHKGVSPILATVILLGVTVVGGGITFALLSSGTQTASSQNIIAVENAQAVMGTDHADLTATIKNAGSKPWQKIEMTVAKSELSEPLLYEALHENAMGCTNTTTEDPATCETSGPTKGRDNPLRMQWLATLDKQSGTTGLADFGEGISVGRKFVFENKDSYRSILVLNGTAVAAAFNGSNGQLGAGLTQCNVGSAWTNCGDLFNNLDTGTTGNILCRNPDINDESIVAECKVFTHVNMGKNISPGESKYFYADAFTKKVQGLNNLFVQVGDALVVNLVAEDVDGGTARAQTIIKVTGV